MLCKKIHKLSYHSSSIRRCLSTFELPYCAFQPDQYKTKLSEEDILKSQSEKLHPSLKRYYEKPVILTQGHLQWVYDHTGTRYLDMFGGIVTTSVGHCHPRLVQSAQRQLNKLWHTSTLYQTEEVHEYAQKLLATLPPTLSNVFFCNSGSEATELAVLLARLHTKSNAVICLNNAYHGCSSTGLSTIGINTWKHNVVVGQGFYHAPNPDPFRGRFGSASCRDSMQDTVEQLADGKCECPSTLIKNRKGQHSVNCTACEEYLQDLNQVIESQVPAGKLAAFIVESIQGVGGTVQYPREYVRKAAQLIRNQNGLLISDEVQTGFGRTGKKFWGFENHGVVPDIVTMAKGIANGFPMAAVVTSKEIAGSLTSGLFFNTYGGNPLACRIASTVLDIIKDEDLQGNCQRLGTYFIQQLAQLQSKHPEVVGDVRGLGLMLGVEMVKEKDSLEPIEKSRMDTLMEKCKQQQLLIGRGGAYNNVIRIKPPMCITTEDVDYTVDVLDQVFKEIK